MSFAKIILTSIQPGIEKLGRLPGSDALFMGIDQYPMAVQTPGAVVIRIKSALLCFANANFIKERYSNNLQACSPCYMLILLSKAIVCVYVYIYIEKYTRPNFICLKISKDSELGHGRTKISR